MLHYYSINFGLLIIHQSHLLWAKIGKYNMKKKIMFWQLARVISFVDGDVYCWGHNCYMQLGTGSTLPGLTPGLLSRTICRKVQQITCGSHHSMVLTIDGEIFAWGYNNCGQVSIYRDKSY